MSSSFSSRQPIVQQNNYNVSYGLLNHLVEPNLDAVPVEPWSIEPGEILYVYPEDYTCYVKTESGKHLPQVTCLSPWFSFSTGAGIYAYPQVNSKVLVGRTNKNDYFILGFLPLQNISDPSTYLNNKSSDLTQGDVHFSTEYGSFFQLCNHGKFIKIECDHKCKIEMESSGHKIFMKSQRIYVNTAAGLLQMDSTDDGRTTTVAYFRMRTGDYDNFVKVIIGNTGVSVGDKLQLNTDGSRSSTKVIFALNICNKASITVDTDGNVVTYCKSIQNRVVEDVDNIINGAISTAVQKGVSTANKGDLRIEATGSIEIAANASLKLSGGQNLNMSSPQVALGATENMEITSGNAMTRSAQLIVDEASKIEHAAGGPGSIPSITNVIVEDSELTGIMDTSISDMEKYNPALASSVPDPTGNNNISYDSSTASLPDYTPIASDTDPETDAPEEAPSKAEIRIVAIAKKEYYKKSRTGNLCREGTMTLYNNDNTVAGSYYFMNGPWGKGAIPLGIYTISGGQRTNQKAMSIKDPVSGKKSGWKFNVSDVYDSRVGATRSLLRIHPDGNTPGSEGCFVISGTYDTLEDFYTKLKAILKANNGKVKLEYKKG